LRNIPRISALVVARGVLIGCVPDEVTRTYVGSLREILGGRNPQFDICDIAVTLRLEILRMVLESVRGRPAAVVEVLHVGVGSGHDEGRPHSWEVPSSRIDGNSPECSWDFVAQVKSVVLVCSENDAISGKCNVFPTVPGTVEAIPVHGLRSPRVTASISKTDSIVDSIESRAVEQVVFLVISAIVGNSVLVVVHPVSIWFSAGNGSTLVQKS